MSIKFQIGPNLRFGGVDIIIIGGQHKIEIWKGLILEICEIDMLFLAP